MDTQRNVIFENLLRQHGYSHRTLAKAVNRISERIYGRPGEATDREVRRWAAGKVRWPIARYLLPLVEIFDRPPEAMGFVPRGASSHLPVPPPRATDEEEKVRRRSFVAGSTAASVALMLGLDETPVSGRLTFTDIQCINGAVGRLDAHFNAIGGGVLLTVATDYIDRLRDAVDRCTYGPGVERALHSSISSLYSSAGWAAHDDGHSDQARLHHAAALQSAILADDKRAQARAWSDLAMQARAEGRHREALQINRAALDSRQARQNPRIAALLHSRLAIGYARARDYRAAARSVLAAQAAHDRFDTAEPAPPWLRFLDTAEIAGLSAIAHQAMGHLPDAEVATAQALQLLPPTMRRNKAYYGVQLAEIQLVQGDLARARATVMRVDTSALRSRHISDRLATVHRTLATA
ncbi:hypothetical protein ACFPFX_11030 [Streptomyces mauvecolor]|uniref:XRE family transcriptional regulator n=1 Tax=Streptomyces mauvecolor TaxID=58345 RepID=A0ABV9UN67_9ACTN